MCAAPSLPRGGPPPPNSHPIHRTQTAPAPPLPVCCAAAVTHVHNTDYGPPALHKQNHNPCLSCSAPCAQACRAELEAVSHQPAVPGSRCTAGRCLLNCRYGGRPSARAKGPSVCLSSCWVAACSRHVMPYGCRQQRQTPAARTATACCLHRDVAAATTSPPAAKLLAHHSLLLLLKHPVAAAPAAAATISKRGVEAAGRPPAHSLLCTHYSWHHS